MSKKIVILGCENSHANTFLNFIDEPEFAGLEVVGVYSGSKSAAESLSCKFDVPVMDAFDSAAGKVDGVIVTARHGAEHYRFAGPYIASGVPMFIDKPITVSESDAVDFMREAKTAGVRLTGGSCLKYEKNVAELKALCGAGPVLGGFVRAPISLKNNYGGFFFYAQHLVETVCEIFGAYPTVVRAYQNGGVITALFRYPEFDVTALFAEENYFYYAGVHTADGIVGHELKPDECFRTEFKEFYKLLHGGAQSIPYGVLIAPVFIMNALDRSLKSGKDERVERYGL